MATETKSFTLQQIGEMVYELELLQQHKQQASNELAALKAPETPAFVEDAQQWNDYLAAKVKFEKDCDELKEQLSEINTRCNDRENWIKNALPSLVWFRVPLPESENFRWVGIKTSNWGGYNTTLCVRKDKPEHPLKHEHYN